MGRHGFSSGRERTPETPEPLEWESRPVLDPNTRSDIGGGHVMHRNDGRAVRVFRLSDIAARERLPGPAAWLPTGRSLSLTQFLYSP
jgi:hypothetical protein